MTTIASSSAAVQPASAPRAGGTHTPRLLDRISAQRQAGSLSATDADALTRAVQDIDQTMAGASGALGGPGLGPSQAASRMDDLIGAEVDKGTLTTDQAATLKGMLSPHKAGGRGHSGGTSPSGAPDAAALGTSAATGASDVLASFLEQLQRQSQTSGYDGTGSSRTATTSQARVFDFNV